MHDALDKVMRAAKQLRNATKKVDPKIAEIIVDLNLHLADLKLQLVEERENALDQLRQLEAHPGSGPAQGVKQPVADPGPGEGSKSWMQGEDLSSVINLRDPSQPGGS